MNAVLQFRQRLGLFQTVLASLLGINRTTLGMVELGHRSLPETAKKRFQEFKAILETLDFTDPVVDPPILFPKEAVKLGYKIRALEREISQLKKELEKVSQKMEAWHKAVVFGKALMEKDFVKQDAALRAEVDLLLDQHYVYRAEKGVRLKKQLAFYLSQKEAEVVFIRSLQNSYHIGTPSGMEQQE
jgi:DNA-binding XRE family transcriptional regulator